MRSSSFVGVVCVFRLKKRYDHSRFYARVRKKNKLPLLSLKLKFLNEKIFILFKEVKKILFLFWKASVQSQETNHILKNPCVIVLISILVLVTMSDIEDKNGHYTAHRAVVRSVTSY